MSLCIGCIDESSLCTHGLREAIERTDHHCVGTFSSLSAFQEFLQSSSQIPDVLISDIRVEKVDVLEAWPTLRKQYPHLRLIVFCSDTNPTHIARACAVGAWDYVLKQHPVGHLMASCASLVAGIPLPESLLQVARKYLDNTECDTSGLERPLTKREEQVLVHLSLGMSNREISSSLGISLETIKEHVQNVLRKVKATDRTAAAVWAIRNGLPSMFPDSSGLLTVLDQNLDADSKTKHTEPRCSTSTAVSS